MLCPHPKRKIQMYSDTDIRKQKISLCWQLILTCILLVFSDAIRAQYNDDSVFNADTISNIQLYDVSAGKEILLNTGSNGKHLTLFAALSFLRSLPLERYQEESGYRQGCGCRRLRMQRR